MQRCVILIQSTSVHSAGNVQALFNGYRLMPPTPKLVNITPFANLFGCICYWARRAGTTARPRGGNLHAFGGLYIMKPCKRLTNHSKFHSKLTNISLKVHSTHIKNPSKIHPKAFKNPSKTHPKSIHNVQKTMPKSRLRRGCAFGAAMGVKGAVHHLSLGVIWRAFSIKNLNKWTKGGQNDPKMTKNAFKIRRQNSMPKTL